MLRLNCMCDSPIFTIIFFDFTHKTCIFTYHKSYNGDLPIIRGCKILLIDNWRESFVADTREFIKYSIYFPTFLHSTHPLLSEATKIVLSNGLWEEVLCITSIPKHRWNRMPLFNCCFSCYSTDTIGILNAGIIIKQGLLSDHGTVEWNIP